MGFFAAGTWKFSENGVKKAVEVLAAGGSALDAAEQGVMNVEDDPHVHSVGLGGYPNMFGESELDAAIMDGTTLGIGAVLGIRGFRHPVSVARRLMEVTPHTVLAGRGADEFAFSEGFKKEPVFSREAMDRWFGIYDKYIMGGQKYPRLDSCMEGAYGTTGNLELQKTDAEEDGGNRSHDTVGIVAMDQKGQTAAATSTSGLWLKHPGRIGDSPLVGSGFYADDEAGMAVGTGVGEDIMRGCMSYLAVSYMSEGLTAMEAAQKAVVKVHRRLSKARGGDHLVGKMAVVCADRYGNFGAAANHEDFFYTYAKDSDKVVVEAAPVCR